MIAGAIPTALYRAYGDSGLLLYIGVSTSFGLRWRAHTCSSAWWAEKRDMSLEWHDSWTRARAAEAAAILAEQPKHNKQHARRPARDSRTVGTINPRPRPAGYLSIAEAALAAECTRQTLYTAIDAGRLEVVTFGGRAIVCEAELARWMPTRPVLQGRPAVSPQQEKFVLDLYLRRPWGQSYSYFIATARALKRHGLVAEGGSRGYILTTVGEQAARRFAEHADQKTLAADLVTSPGLQMDGTPIPASIPSPAREEAA